MLKTLTGSKKATKKVYSYENSLLSVYKDLSNDELIAKVESLANEARETTDELSKGLISKAKNMAKRELANRGIYI